jgi:hypothetical protein
MERWRVRQRSLFESRPRGAELPEPQRQKAVLLLGVLLTEALALQNECEDLERLREGRDDEDYR